MCGICGLFGPFPNSEQLIRLMTSSMTHRGPDGEGIFQDDNNYILLGHRRLSIIDLSDDGHQPMIDSSGRFVITYNGEIYNYRELRDELTKLGHIFVTKSDTEVILESYKEWGVYCLDHFRGMFAFAIADLGERFGPPVKNLDKIPPFPNIFLARDRLGIKPLLYIKTPNGLAFASELRALRDSDIVKPYVSPAAILEFFSFGAIQQPKTIYEDVFHLSPGHMMFAWNQGNSLKIERWWDLFTASEKLKQRYSTQSSESLIEKTREILEEAARYHVVGDVPVGAFLSGGVDSAVVTALMAQQNTDIHTYSIGFTKFGENIDESYAAAQTAEFIGTNHHPYKVSPEFISESWERIIYALDQPSGDGFNTWLVSRVASHDIKAAISGLGGDELFAGYPFFSDFCKTWNKNPSIIDSISRFLYTQFPNRFAGIRTILATPLCERVIFARRIINQYQLKKILSPNLLPFLPYLDGLPPLPDNPEFLGPVSLLSYAEISGYLSSTLLRDSDSMSMYHSLELRPMLLDHILVVHAFALPDELKHDGNRYKIALIESMQDIIPNECWNRPKTGFCLPFIHWMNTTLNDRVCTSFESPTARILLRNSYRTKLLKLAKNKDTTKEMWPIFILIQWMIQNNCSIFQGKIDE